MCEVSKADIQAHVAERLEREHAEKERRRREKLEAHLYLQVGAPDPNHLIHPRFSTNRVWARSWRRISTCKWGAPVPSALPRVRPSSRPAPQPAPRPAPRRARVRPWLWRWHAGRRLRASALLRRRRRPGPARHSRRAGSGCTQSMGAVRRAAPRVH